MYEQIMEALDRARGLIDDVENVKAYKALDALYQVLHEMLRDTPSVTTMTPEMLAQMIDVAKKETASEKKKDAAASKKAAESVAKMQEKAYL